MHHKIREPCVRANKRTSMAMRSMRITYSANQAECPSGLLFARFLGKEAPALLVGRRLMDVENLVPASLLEASVPDCAVKRKCSSKSEGGWTGLVFGVG